MSSVVHRQTTVFLLVLGTLFAVGADTACAQGSAYTWGYNLQGQLGNGTSVYSSATPVPVTNMTTGVTAVGAGSITSYSVRNGAAYAWGDNSDGELGSGTVYNSSTPVAVTGLSSGVTAVTGGEGFGLAVKGGAIYAWGGNDYGELGNGTTTNTSTPVAAVGMTSGVTAIAGGNSHSLAIQTGAAYAWGGNYYGQLGDGTTTQRNAPAAVKGLASGVTAIAAGDGHSLAIKNGVVYAWGYNFFGQLGNGATTNVSAPYALGLSSGVTAIAAGGFHSLAAQNGNVYAWGSNNHGQLGDGTMTDSHSPIKIDPSDLNDIVAVAASTSSSFALSADGSLWVWGDNFYGELGVGTTASSYTTPQHLLPPSGYVYTAISGEAESETAVAILMPSLPKVASLSRLASGHFVLKASSGAPNTVYTIQASSDLSTNSFTTVGTATTDATGTLQYDDAGAVGLARKFYRVTYP